MKTTLEVPDDLYRKVKSRAALRRRKIKDYVVLDTNALIALSYPQHKMFQTIEASLRRGARASTCSVVWQEYVREPLLDQDRARALRVIESRMIALERRNA